MEFLIPYNFHTTSVYQNHIYSIDEWDTALEAILDSEGDAERETEE